MRGYVKRPNCVPTWVKASKASDKSDQELDAFTGATPQAGGKQTFSWDFTDQQGKKVKDGKYCVKVEATLYQASNILYNLLNKRQGRQYNPHIIPYRTSRKP